MMGQEDLSQWDDDEIFFGRRRDKHGKLRGAPPKMVPRALEVERIRRRQQEAIKLLKTGLVDAVALLLNVVNDRRQYRGEDGRDHLVTPIRYRIEAAKEITRLGFPQQHLHMIMADVVQHEPAPYERIAIHEHRVELDDDVLRAIWDSAKRLDIDPDKLLDEFKRGQNGSRVRVVEEDQ